MRNFNSRPIQCAECTHDLAIGGSGGNVIGLAAAINEAWAPVMAQIADNVQAEGVLLNRVQPTPGHTIAVKFTPPTSGSLPGSVLPTASAMLALRRTGVFGRQNQGRLFIPWTTEAQTDATFNNQIGESARGGMDNALNAWRVILGGANAAGVTAYPVVYSHRSASGGVHWAYITKYETQTHYRSLAKRGRRTGDCPPFEENPTGDRIATRGQGFFYGPTGAFVNDHRVWQTIRSISSCYPTVVTDPAVYSLPGFNASAWHGENEVSTIGENRRNPCEPTSDTWDWPPDVFIDYDDPTFDLALCFGPWQAFGVCGVGLELGAQQAGEVVHYRRQWRQSAEPVAMVLVKVNADDSYELWIDGQFIGERPPMQQPAFEYLQPDTYDVTELITPGDNHCIGVKGFFGGPNASGSRAGPCTYPGHTPTWLDFRHGWVALELRTWHGLPSDAAAAEPADSAIAVPV